MEAICAGYKSDSLHLLLPTLLYDDPAMQTTATFRTLPAEPRQSVFQLLRAWLRHLRGSSGTKFSQTVLPKGGLQRICISAGATLTCSRGTLWISDTHGWEIVLEAGRSMEFDLEEDVLVEALAPAQYTVSAAGVSV